VNVDEMPRAMWEEMVAERDALAAELALVSGRAMTITTVGGIEMYNHHERLELDGLLRHCPFCGYEAGYDTTDLIANAPGKWIRVECTNSSCGVATPFHYRTRESAREGWNRRHEFGEDSFE
jgi:Restriction alleviation protein Lar